MRQQQFSSRYIPSILTFLGVILLPYVFTPGHILVLPDLRRGYDLINLFIYAAMSTFFLYNYHVLVPQLYLAKKQNRYRLLITSAFLILIVVSLIPNLDFDPRPILPMDDRPPGLLQPPPKPSPFLQIGHTVFIFLGGVFLSLFLRVRDHLYKVEGEKLQTELNFVNVNDNCKPIPNARVDIWHCDKDGVYSGYSQPGANTVGQTFCRGIQITDTNGQVTFTTVYPGWYAGRITHIHFEIYLSSVLNATSQMAFPEDITSTVYNSTLYAAKGQNTSVRSFSADNVFSDGTSLQMATVTGNLTDGYVATLNVGIRAPISTGLLNIEPETGRQFKLGNNYPNPFKEKTLLTFELFNGAKVMIELFDVEGRKVQTVLDQNLPVGEHRFELERKGLPSGVYAYQLSTQNEMGIFRKSKVLTIL